MVVVCAILFNNRIAVYDEKGINNLIVLFFMNIVSLQRRLVSTIIDKIIILFLFVAVAIIFCSGAPGAELGAFTFLTSREYNIIESEKTIKERGMELDRFIKANGYSFHPNKYDGGFEDYKTEMDVYQKYIGMFMLVNLLYYLLCELAFKASLGKRMLKCKIQTKGGGEMKKRDVFKRTGILAALLIFAVALQKVLGVNALITSLLFFGILDFTVLTKRMSLVDKFSDTLVIKQK